MSQQRVHVPDASLPSTGSARAIVPPLRRYYQGTATSCRPSRRVSFPSLGGATGSRIFRSRRRCARRRRAWGWSPGIPVRAFFRGDGRISQVPGEPPFPFAHVLRPRPADASLTDCGTLAWPPLPERQRRRRLNTFRGSIAWLSGSPPTYHDVGYPSPRKTGFQVLVRLSWAGFYPQGSDKRFQLTSCGLSSSSKLLGTIRLEISIFGCESRVRVTQVTSQVGIVFWGCGTRLPERWSMRVSVRRKFDLPAGDAVGCSLALRRNGKDWAGSGRTESGRCSAE